MEGECVEEGGEGGVGFREDLGEGRKGVSLGMLGEN